MKIEELDWWHYNDMDHPHCPNGPFIAKSALPPLRDVKTDPPKQFGFFCVYDACKLFCGIGTNFATDDGMHWVDEFNNLISPAFWSEILHW